MNCYAADYIPKKLLAIDINLPSRDGMQQACTKWLASSSKLLADHGIHKVLFLEQVGTHICFLVKCIEFLNRESCTSSYLGSGTFSREAK